MIKLIPLYDCKAIFRALPYCLEGLEDILKYSTGDSSFEKIVNEIVSGQLIMWVGFNNNNYCGFMTTKMVQYPFTEKTLWIMHAFLKKGLNKEVFFENLTNVVEFARKEKCTLIKFYSVRDKAFNRKLKKEGWNFGYQEFLFNIK